MNSSPPVGLAKIDYKSIAAKYRGFNNTWSCAFVGFPRKPFHIDADFLGSMKDTSGLNASVGTVPVVIHAHGSGPFADQVFQKSFTAAVYLFIAPNSHAMEGRPTHNIPFSSKETYETIHAIRQAEISYAVEKVLAFPFVDKSNIFLVGSSEGGLASARYPGSEFKGRVVMGWACEAGYFTDYPRIGAHPKDPFLNIVGYHDEYFGVEAPASAGRDITGNCGRALAMGGFENSKVIIYPEGRHNNRNNQYIISDIISFIDYWKDRSVKK
jgi:dienelactone hydrolase